MTTELTKTGIRLDEVRFWRETRWEETEEVTRWYGSAGYIVETAEGEEWSRNLQQEITGAVKTKASELLEMIRAAILAKEGLA